MNRDGVFTHNSERAMNFPFRRIVTLLLTCHLLVMPIACSTNEAREARWLRAHLGKMNFVDQNADWIMQALSQNSGNRLITIETAPEWNDLEVLERRIEHGAVVCDRYSQAPGKGASDTAYVSERLYSIEGPAACVMFNSLYGQVCEGYEYRSPYFGMGDTNPFSVYLVVTGDCTAITVDEGSVAPTGRIIMHVETWDHLRAMGKQPTDMDLARGYLAPGAFRSISGYIALAVDYFDDLCIVIEASAPEDK